MAKKRRIEYRPSKTAIGTAVMRAMAAKEFKGEKFGPDYLAEKFVPLKQTVLLLKIASIRKYAITKKLPSGIYEYAIARTMYFDKIFREALEEGWPQIVFLGAGYDTRAYRFRDFITKTRIFELDASITQQHKKKILLREGIDVSDNVIFVPINFETDSIQEALTNTSYNPNHRTLFIWEGVTAYLTPAAVDATLRAVKDSSPSGSAIAFDYGVTSSTLLEKYGVKEMLDHMKTVNADEYREDGFAIEEGTLEAFLSERGFRVVYNYVTGDLEQQFLILESGSLLGHITGNICIVYAVVV